MTEEERLPGSLVQVPDPPPPYFNRMDMARIDLLRKLDSNRLLSQGRVDLGPL